MGALTSEDARAALEAPADVVAWEPGFVHALAVASESLGITGRVHVKLDTGMGRLGAKETEQALAVAKLVADAPHLELVGLMTHFATADELGDAFFGEQLERFRAWAVPHKERNGALVLHAANSAGTLRDASAHFDMVRCGIAIYGMDPFGEDPAARGLEPAMELRSYVAEVKPIAPGESAGYGRRFIAERDTRIATIPVGYGDGFRRGLTNRARVMIAGRPYPLVGTVSMDNVTADVGPDGAVRPGDAAVLLGEGILAEELARALDTINYEITCGITARVPRVYE